MNCIICGISTPLKKNSKDKFVKFCGKSCLKKAHPSKKYSPKSLIANCRRCDKEFTRNPKSKGATKYCSDECRISAWREIGRKWSAEVFRDRRQRYEMERQLKIATDPEYARREKERRERKKLGRDEWIKQKLQSDPVFAEEYKTKRTLKKKLQKERLRNSGLLQKWHRQKRLRKYGLTFESFDNFIKHQENRCAICRKEFNDKIKPKIDHSHETGLTRGILCNGCNSMLGHAKDSIKTLQAAIEYLRKFGNGLLIAK